MAEDLDQKNILRNQKAHQEQHEYKLHHDQHLHTSFDSIGLTKRNADYMFKFHRAFQDVKLPLDRKHTIEQTMVKDLLTAQKRGITARHKYGTVAHRIHLIVHPPKKVVPMNKNYWPNAIYNMVIFFVLFNILYGITYMISKQTSQQKGAAGFVGLLVTSIVAGLGMPIITRLFDDHIKHTHSGWLRALAMIGMFLAWMAVFYLTAMMPRVLNPVFAPWVDLVMAAVGIVVAIWMHQKYNVASGFAKPRR